mmetsp:Transcript_73941/g.186339  ORF Transcript_73941/g.186339 Transcript_73941/m.186339 type:complete len:247 (+) Transcript_73941:137-877(+)
MCMGTPVSSRHEIPRRRRSSARTSQLAVRSSSASIAALMRCGLQASAGSHPASRGGHAGGGGDGCLISSTSRCCCCCCCCSCCCSAMTVFKELHTLSTRSRRSSEERWWCKTDSRKAAKSRAETMAPGLSLQMQSSSSWKPSRFVFPSLSASVGSNSNSTYMSNCFSLMSSTSRACMTLGSRFISLNSSRLILPDLSESIWSKIVMMLSRTESSTMDSFSLSAVLPTTSTKMPTSMFIIVKEFKRM